MHELLAQWPYLSDLSLIWAAASIFQPASPADVAAADADPAHQAAAAAAQRVLQEPAVQPWLYFNLIAHNSHIFAPVMDLVSSRTPMLLLVLACEAFVQLPYIVQHRRISHNMPATAVA